MHLDELVDAVGVGNLAEVAFLGGYDVFPEVARDDPEPGGALLGLEPALLVQGSLESGYGALRQFSLSRTRTPD